MAGDTSLPPHPQQQEQEQEYNHNKDDDLIAELTHHMDRFLLQDHHHDDHIYDFSSSNSQLSWDLMGSPQSTLWSPLPSSEASSQEPSPPPTPASYQSLIQEQIRAIELTRLKQEQILPMNQKLMTESEESLLCQQKKGKAGGGAALGRRARPPPRPAPLLLQQPQQCGGGGMRALFLGAPASRGGTGVFLPRAAAAAAATPPPQSTTKQGKGCSTVLIPARVVQALQQHFDQMAATAGPKAAASFPPLHDVIVNSNRDGMYSLEKRQSREAPIQNEMILPQEWTY
ncbi:hypothetical protein PIB30_008271 [Stylosanthes scabra]|uniref:Uncharacterized protein n=1 Tax=Stylosanthes scabra TaxID=79078 RepID=A0ABU6R3S9_9FABA|nr:hypothetical protein [Stylosanthes scabra]